MEKEFIPYEQALALKELGFNEECLAGYNKETNELYISYEDGEPTFNQEYYVLAPIYQQAFRWFRDRKMLGEINPIDDWDSWTYIIFLEDIMSPFFVASIGNEYKTHQEAQLECLRRLIEIVKGK
jgi:hypothetical protein